MQALAVRRTVATSQLPELGPFAVRSVCEEHLARMQGSGAELREPQPAAPPTAPAHGAQHATAKSPGPQLQNGVHQAPMQLLDAGEPLPLNDPLCAPLAHQLSSALAGDAHRDFDSLLDGLDLGGDLAMPELPEHPALTGAAGIDDATLEDIMAEFGGEGPMATQAAGRAVESAGTGEAHDIAEVFAADPDARGVLADSAARGADLGADELDHFLEQSGMFLLENGGISIADLMEFEGSDMHSMEAHSSAHGLAADFAAQRVNGIHGGLAPQAADMRAKVNRSKGNGTVRAASKKGAGAGADAKHLPAAFVRMLKARGASAAQVRAAIARSQRRRGLAAARSRRVKESFLAVSAAEPAPASNRQGSGGDAAPAAMCAANARRAAC
jgi:hypothetical protein